MPHRSRKTLVTLFVLALCGCGGGGGGGGSSSPPPPPPTISAFAATPSAMTPGSSSTLSWTVSGATSLKVDQGVGSVAGTSVAVTPPATTIYTLTATNAGGSVTVTTTVRVGAAPVIASFAAHPSWITTGQSAALTWSVIGATALNIDARGSVTGNNVQVSPVADASYLLTASNEFGSATANISVAVFPPPTVWFGPHGADSASPIKGSIDYFDLFNPAAPWAQAAAHVAVFEMPMESLGLDDATLRNMFADLKRRHIAFAIDWGPLVAEGVCGVGIEGFDGGGLAAAETLKHMRDLGGTLQYLAFDEPYSGALWSPACGWTPNHAAQNAAQQVAQIKTIFPDVIVGDIEPVTAGQDVPGLLDGYQAWIEAWERVTGTPFAFFHGDIPEDGDWEPSVAVLARFLKERHIPFGKIYTGGEVPSDAGWVNAAKAFYENYETHGGSIPDQVDFMSWMPYPKHLLPETDPSTFTHLINTYFRGRTTLTASANASSFQGRLTTRDVGSPIGNAPVVVTAVPLTGTGQPTTYTSTGIVPPGTQYATFGIRAGTECGWPLPAEFSVSSFVLDAGIAGRISGDFTNQLTGWGQSGTPSLLQVINGNLEVLVKPGEMLNLNPDPIPFSAAGAHFTFTVNATIPIGSHGNACLVAIFLGATPPELPRVVIPLRPQPISVGSALTAMDGSFSVDLGSLPPVNLQLWADYPGSDALWPAATSITVGNAPPLSVTTASLPSGTVGTAYSQSLAATGGLTQYLWVGFGLPPGLTLHQDGTLTGTPTVAGNYTVSVTVVDDSAPTRIVDYSLPVVIY